MLRKIVQTIHTFMVAALFSVTPAVSQDLPQYEGVYIFALSGWTKLSPLNKDYESFQVKSNTGDNVTSLKYSLITLNDSDFNSVRLDTSSLSTYLRILVISRSEELQRVDYVVRFDPYVYELSQKINPGGYAVASGSLAIAEWGWRRDTFDTLILQNSATEHRLIAPKYGQFGAPSFGQRELVGEAFHVAEGLAIRTNTSVYAVAFGRTDPVERPEKKSNDVLPTVLPNRNDLMSGSIDAERIFLTLQSVVCLDGCEIIGSQDSYLAYPGKAFDGLVGSAEASYRIESSQGKITFTPYAYGQDKALESLDAYYVFPRSCVPDCKFSAIIVYDAEGNGYFFDSERLNFSIKRSSLRN